MRKSLEQLIEISTDVRYHLNVSSFVIYNYEDGGYTEFKVDKVPNAAELVRIANGLHVTIYHEDSYIAIRLYEDYNE